MSLKLDLPKLTDLRPRITVMGVGGAGGNAINNMIASGLSGVEFVAANTDAQALAISSAERRLQLGINTTEGLGAGARPEIGEAAAEEARDDIRSELSGSHMVFIAAGMGGGTGSGAAPIIAQAARELGALTVAIVSKPFQFEGTRRMRIAETGIERLRPEVDTIIIIPNQNLFRIANERTTFAEAFVMADQVLYSGIACIVDLIMKDGLINLDFADVRAVMEDMGTAVMGTGEAEGDQRAVLAAEDALANPLLDTVELGKAQGLLVSIVGGSDMTLFEVDEAANRVRQEVDPDANIIVGATFDTDCGERLRVSIVATGMDRRDLMPPELGAPNSDGQTTQSAVETRDPSELLNGGVPSANAASVPLPPPLPETPAEHVQSHDRVTGSAPAGSGSKADQFERVLSGASSADPAAPTWQSSQGVVIEPETPAAASSNTQVPPQSPTVPQASETHAPVFAPVAPAEARPSRPRMPGVEAFPEHAQREYAAKTAGENVASAQRKPAPGLFGRLTSLGRKGESEASDHASGNEASVSDGVRRKA